MRTGIIVANKEKELAQDKSVQYRNTATPDPGSDRR